ncbi:MAG: hypothetical protein KBC66_09515 [Kiritimatiellae bacterium]|jgi:hypothetical protein|nr:hypothetical protein [Kiritimatiellia bacterium]
MIKVTVWNNGAHHADGNGYGVKVKEADRQKYFNDNWTEVNLILMGGKAPVVCRTDKTSFSNRSCGELIDKEIGKWLLARRLAPWSSGHPPILFLIPLFNNWFLLV